jgi:glutaminyl-peptide cyclotransferase
MSLRSAASAVIGLLALWAACVSESTPAAAPSAVATVVPTVIRSLPHDTLAFTQGLFYRDGRLYESTGAPDQRQSSLRIIDAKSGAVLASQPVAGVFAEGLALLKGDVVQLTWREGRAFVRRFPSLAPCEVTFTYQGEGWGLTSNRERWIMSNGSDTLCVRDSEFHVLRHLPVRLAGRPLTQLNELEYANGKIYANIWYSVLIAEIDPTSGVVLRTIDCTELARLAGVDAARKVLNGIAFDAASGHFYLTGKDWPKMFEVTLP